MSDNQEHHRRVAFLAGLQFALIVGGWLALAIAMKFAGYPDDNPMVRFKPIPVALREHGMWALLVPLLFAICGLVAGESPDSRGEKISFAISWICYATSIALLLAFLGSAASPYTRGLLIKYM
jgi:hypothetical protein